MAVNIFTGSKGSGGKSKKSANSTSNLSRVQNAKEALRGSGVTSSSGNVAVGTGNSFLQKAGNLVGKVAGVASKFLPGLGGTIANAVSNLFNDPEWWQSTPGDALTLNESLRAVELEGLGPSDANGTAPAHPRIMVRAAIAEINSIDNPYVVGKFYPVIHPTQQMVTQYLMAQVRRVVNAVPLQTAEDYATAFEVNASIYAIWRQFKKFDYMCKHGQTYLANMNDDAFPLFQTKNAAWLQATINRLEEYLRANVRLPHTLCEYLAWRFGRVYRSNDSAKAGLILYNYGTISFDPTRWDQIINALMNTIAVTPSIQRANVDLYNTYIDHDLFVEVRDDTQFRYDKKEFMLRLNLQAPGEDLETLVAIDSSLDNPTAFMASTVSSIGKDAAGNYTQLFPTARSIWVYTPGVPTVDDDGTVTINGLYVKKPDDDFASASILTPIGGDSIWAQTEIAMNNYVTSADPDLGTFNILTTFAVSLIAKSLDLYNLGIYIAYGYTENDDDFGWVDITALSIDAGAPTMATIDTEHVYAFANLIGYERKHSLSYNAAEKQVARDTAEFLDKVEVAAPAAASGGTTTTSGGRGGSQGGGGGGAGSRGV